ncbi:MAG: metallopeptidase family protein [bacterium]
MDKRFFEQLVLKALDELPHSLWNKMENISVSVEEEPSPDVLKKQGIRPPQTLLGLYHGVPRNKRGLHYANVLPDKITIYKKPIESLGLNDIQLTEKIKEVVLHEIGHYFGFGEEELQKYLNGK